jgi:hypothetical protein
MGRTLAAVESRYRLATMAERVHRLGQRRVKP